MCILISGSLFYGDRNTQQPILFKFSIEGSCILVQNKRVDDECIPNVCKVMQITTFTTMWQQIIILTHLMEQAIQTLYIFYFYNISILSQLYIYLTTIYNPNIQNSTPIFFIIPLYFLSIFYIFYIFILHQTLSYIQFRFLFYNYILHLYPI